MGYIIIIMYTSQADLRDFIGSVSDHYNKMNISIKQVTEKFWFPSACKS